MLPWLRFPAKAKRRGGVCVVPKQAKFGWRVLMSYYVNPDIKNTFRIFPKQGRYGYHRYDLNENPEGLPKEFVREVLSEITPEFLATYPEPDLFLKKYAAYIGLEFENVMAVNGSDMGLRYIFETFGEHGKKVVTVSPTFGMYAVNCSILGLVNAPVSYNDDLSIDIDKIICEIDEDTRIVALVNPNNPIGNAYSDDEIERIVKRAQEVGAVVVVDEAYHYFYEGTFIDRIKDFDNLIVLRTFSKLFSIAACRIGVIISNPEFIGYLNNGRLTFDVNSIALLFAERLLDRRDVIEDLIANAKEGKAYTLEKLEKLGYECKHCAGNYIFVKPHHNPKELVQKLANEKKVLVHGFDNELLKDFIRVSIGSKKAMEYFVQAFIEADIT